MRSDRVRLIVHTVDGKSFTVPEFSRDQAEGGPASELDRALMGADNIELLRFATRSGEVLVSRLNIVRIDIERR